MKRNIWQKKKEIQLFLYIQCFRFCTLTSFPSVPIYYFLIHHTLAYWPQIKWQLGYIFQDVKISGWKVNHLKVLSKWCQTWIYLETTLTFGVIETKQRVDNWIIHFSMRCFGVTRTLLKSSLPLVGLELWFQLLIIVQVDHRKFAKPEFFSNELVNVRSSVAAQLFWDILKDFSCF